MKTLAIDLNTFPFYKRDMVDGKIVTNRCGRDFLYYALAYYFSKEYGEGKITACDLEYKGHFGISVPAWLSWSQIQFLRVPEYLKKKNLQLSINNKKISSFRDFVKAILFSYVKFENAISDVEKIVNKNEVAGIDISIGFFGLLDHVMFVYGYDDENLYVFETTKAPIAYKSISDEHLYVMKLPKEEIRKRWTRFGRVWGVFS